MEKRVFVTCIFIIIIVLSLVFWRKYLYAPTVSHDIDCLQKIVVGEYIKETGKYNEIIIEDSEQKEYIYNLLKNAKHSCFIRYVDAGWQGDSRYYLKFIYTDGLDCFDLIARKNNKWLKAIHDDKGIVIAELSITCDGLAQYLDELCASNRTVQ